MDSVLQYEPIRDKAFKCSFDPLHVTPWETCNVQAREDGLVTVDMGPPELNGPKVPTTLPPNADGVVLKAPIQVRQRYKFILFYKSSITTTILHITRTRTGVLCMIEPFWDRYWFMSDH